MAVAMPDLTSWLADRAGAADEVDPRLRHRLRVVACCLLLVALAFVTRPGRIIADTKIDLALNPLGFLGHGLHLWDQEQFGQLQNQSAGYFFPMGPFYALGRLAGMQPWVVQRLWLAAVMIAAFLGTMRLAGRLSIGTPAAQIVGGLAYALSPRALSLLGQLSAEALPAAMMPWIILPLAAALSGGSRIRAAVRSSVAVALCGGTNATVTLGVALAPVIFVLTADRRAPRWRILGWWSGAVVLATISWTIPLLLIQKYAFNWLTYTESADITTATTSIFNTLRGAEDWVSYLFVNGQPWLAVSNALASQPVLVLLTGAAAAAGVAGLLHHDLPARRFLLCLLLAGIAIIGAGHLSSLQGPLAGQVRELINGPLAPMRNLRKFDPMIRLPVCLGLTHLLAGASRPRLRRGIRVAAVATVAAIAVPAFANGLSARGDFQQVPGYWRQAAGWLNQHTGDHKVLEVPAAAFGEYVWGRPMDDILEPLATVDWAVRGISAAGSVGFTRLLDVIDQRLTAGDGSAGLAGLLARMDIKYLLVRNDLARAGLAGAWPARVHQALGASPGIARVATFGPPVGGTGPDDAVTAFDPPYPALEVYQVAAVGPTAGVLPADQAIRVVGDPGALATLADAGLVAGRPVLLNGDAGAGGRVPLVVTDSLRRRVRAFGELRSDASQTLTGAVPLRTYEAVPDLTEPGWTADMAVAQYYGIKDVSASSSAADLDAIPSISATGYLPYAAFDGDYRTGWVTGGWHGPAGQWIQAGLSRPITVARVRATFVVNPFLGAPVAAVAVQTAAGSLVQQVRPSAGPQTLLVPPGATTWLRIRIVAMAAQPSPPSGLQAAMISEISIPGVHAGRSIRLPAPGSGVGSSGAPDPDAIVMAAAEPVHATCMPTPLRWVCSPLLARPTEEQYSFDRTFSLAVGSGASLTGTATLTDPARIAAYTRPGADATRVTGSSTELADPQQLPAAAFDGDPRTSWIASPGDAQPTLSIRWGTAIAVGRLTIERPPGASGPLRVSLSGTGGQARGGFVNAAGSLTFRPMRTNRLTLIFSPVQAPLQISELVIPGVPHLAAASAGPFRLLCGFGPVLTIGGVRVETRIYGTFAQALRGQPMTYTACRAVRLTSGDNRLSESGSDGFHIDTAILRLPGAAAGRGRSPATAASGTARPGTAATASRTAAPPAAALPASARASGRARVLSWQPGRRQIRVVAPRRSYLVVAENYNTGWQARIGPAVLAPVRLDGWEQAWVLPAGTNAVVTLVYPADTAYRFALFGGLATVAVLILVALIPARRPRRAVPATTARGGSTAAVAALANGTANGTATGTAPGQREGQGEDIGAGTAPGAGEGTKARMAPGPGEGQGAGAGAGAALGTASGSTAIGTSRDRALASAAAAGVTAGAVTAALGMWLAGWAGAAVTVAAAAAYWVARLRADRVGWTADRPSRLAGRVGGWPAHPPGGPARVPGGGVPACQQGEPGRAERGGGGVVAWRLWCGLCSPWLAAGLLAAAAAMDVYGLHLRGLAGASTGLTTICYDAGPQLICLAVAGRIVAGLLWSGPVADRPAGPKGGHVAARAEGEPAGTGAGPASR
jgi:arabinofuranan 3-O-arabinosyltransferase